MSMTHAEKLFLVKTAGKQLAELLRTVPEAIAPLTTARNVESWGNRLGNRGRGWGRAGKEMAEVALKSRPEINAGYDTVPGFTGDVRAVDGIVRHELAKELAGSRHAINAWRKTQNPSHWGIRQQENPRPLPSATQAAEKPKVTLSQLREGIARNVHGVIGEGAKNIGEDTAKSFRPGAGSAILGATIAGGTAGHFYGKRQEEKEHPIQTRIRHLLGK